ncbi:MAG: heavy-metal-associated domain-containing protein [Sphingopyxis terrae]|nr:heavy-metal-associated domain-containing protein [Sphingopyxis terrae]
MFTSKLSSEVTFSVTDMMCEGCAEKVQAILSAVEGVQKVKSSVWRKRVRVQFDPDRVESRRLRAELEAGGFAAGEVTK